METQKTKNYNAIDLVKFICSLLIVLLHVPCYVFADMAVDGAPPTGANAGLLITFGLPAFYTFLRIAVPFFFICSSFFLFKKIKENPEKRSEIIKKYCIRILKLWFFWFIVSLPYTIDKFIFNSNYVWWQGLLILLGKTLFSGGFDGAWYLIASIVSVLIINKITTKHSNKFAFIFSLCFYLLAIFEGNFIGIFQNAEFKNFIFYFNQIMPLFNSFFAALIYITIGKIFAENENLISSKLAITGVIAFIPLMFAELLSVNYLGFSVETDCFLSLIPFSICFMQVVLNIQLKPSNKYLFLRKTSTYIYLSHFLILYVFYRFVNLFNWTIFLNNIPMFFVIFVSIIIICLCLCKLTLQLSKHKNFEWLKYSL